MESYVVPMKKIALGKYDNFLPSFVINCIQVYEVGLSHPLAAAAATMLISLMLPFNSLVNIVLCIWPLFIQLIQIFFSHWHYVYSSKIGSIKLFDAYMDALKEFDVRYVNGSQMNTEGILRKACEWVTNEHWNWQIASHPVPWSSYGAEGIWCNSSMQSNLQGSLSLFYLIWNFGRRVAFKLKSEHAFAQAGSKPEIKMSRT
jgi:hypothetical protein